MNRAAWSAGHEDEAGQRILSILAEEGRITMSELARRVGLSVSATSRRVRRLVGEARILGFHAVVDTGKLCSGTLAFTRVRLALDSLGPESEPDEHLRAALARCEEILECWQLGDADLLIKSRTDGVEAYHELLSRVIWRLPGVCETRSYVVVDVVKLAPPWAEEGG